MAEFNAKCRMLRAVQHFGKNCSCHFQGKYVLDGHFCHVCVGQRLGKVLNVMTMIGGADEDAATQ